MSEDAARKALREIAEEKRRKRLEQESKQQQQQQAESPKPEQKVQIPTQPVSPQPSSVPQPQPNSFPQPQPTPQPAFSDSGLHFDDDDQYSCPACTFLNPLSANACAACGTPSPLAHQTPNQNQPLSQSNPAPVVSQPPSNLESPGFLDGNNWVCGGCTFRQSKDNEFCEACGQPNAFHPSNRPPEEQKVQRLISDDEPAGFSFLNPFRPSGYHPVNEHPNDLPPSQAFPSQPQPQQLHQAPQQQPQQPQQQRGFFSRMFGSSSSSSSSSVQNPSKRWICERCGADNYYKVIRCKNCPNPNMNMAMQEPGGGDCTIS